MQNSSWKTTTTGITAIIVTIGSVTQLLLDDNPNTNPDWNVVVSSLITSIGLIFARDNNKTSEQVGAKQ